MTTFRLPLASFSENRDSSGDKDALITNGYLEETYVIKRPGCYVEIAGGGTAQGVFAYGSNVYSFDSVNTATTPVITPIASLS